MREDVCQPSERASGVMVKRGLALANRPRGVAKAAYRRLPWIMPHVIDPLTRFAVGRLGLDHDGVRVLEIKGRTSGRWRATPVRVLDLNGRQYLVAPQGETQWVRNLRVQRCGRLRMGGRVTDFQAEELSDQDKVAVLRAYLRRWWSQTARLTTLTAPDAPDAEVMRAAPLHPAFRLMSAGVQQAKESRT
jgi:deazaflavin-dependent oxidoreductase (nitroreductase family)